MKKSIYDEAMESVLLDGSAGAAAWLSAVADGAPGDFARQYEVGMAFEGVLHDIPTAMSYYSRALALSKEYSAEMGGLLSRMVLCSERMGMLEQSRMYLCALKQCRAFLKHTGQLRQLSGPRHRMWQEIEKILLAREGRNTD